ncbi:MAG: filamentous hemagglutinin N-terminal domain-containing protein [Parvibaculum sp.]|uniref:beta strand repeat-containing protein n=2 Tax=Parvibaculum sp. TaxID=2024848 RepID=UPI0032EBF373
MSGPRDMRRAARTGLAVAISVAWVAAGSPLRAEPTNPVIVGDSAGLGAGAATIGSVSNGPGTDMTIDQHAERVFIDWASFNIGASDSVSFQQGGSQWIAVNRVTGGLGPTTIDGMLTANGHVWIIDPAGIAFSSTAVVDVGGLLATASNIDPGDFLAVTDLEDETGFTFAFGGNDGARVSNAGTINSSGLLAMVAPLVDNSGTLESTYGDVLLGGANAFRLSFTQVERPADADHQTAFDELLVTDFIIETPVTNDPVPGNETVPVTNTGNLTGANVIVSAASAGGGAFINMDGVVEATSIGDQSGDVVILGGGDFTDGAADAASSGSEAIRIENADITAAGDFVAQGTGVSIEKGTGPGTITAGSSRIAATSGDVTSDTNLTTTGGGMDISASGLVSVAALDASTTIDIEAADVDLGGGVVAGSTIAMEATAGDISGTDIDIEGASVELTGQVTATDSASIVATTGNATLNDDMTSTGSILIGAASGKVTAAGLDADTTLGVTAGDIDLNGTVTGGGAVTLEATAGDISGTDIDIAGASVELTGPVNATDSAAIVATTGDATINDDITSSGSILNEAASGKVTAAGLDADTTLGLTAEDIDLNGTVLGGGAVTMTATAGDISGTDIDIGGASVELTGTVAATDSASITATTGDLTLNNDMTSTGSILLEAAEGKATTAGLEADTTLDITADDIEVTGNATAGGALSMVAELLGIDLQGAVEAASVSLDAEGNVTATGTITSTAGEIGIEAGGDTGLAALDAATTLDVIAEDIDLNGAVAGGGAVTIEATAGDISGTDIDIEGASVELTGPVTATDSASIVATAGDATLNDDLTSTGSILIEAASGKISATGLDAATTLDVTAADIDLDGTVVGGGAVTMEATAGDISGTDIDIEGASVELTGPVTATDSASIVATTGDATLNDDMTSTGSILIEAASGKVIAAGLDADTTLGVTAGDIDLNGTVTGGGAVTVEATAGDISGTDIDIEGASVELTGPVTATDSASIVATTGDATLNDDMTSTGSILIEATEGEVTTAGLDADTTLDITADDIEVTDVATAGGALAMIAELLDIDLQGAVEAASVYLEAARDIMAADSITATSGAIEIEAGGEVDLVSLDAATTIDVTAAALEVSGDASASGDATFRAMTGDATFGGKTSSTNGDVLIEAKLGHASAEDIESKLDTTIVAGAVSVLGDIVSMGQVALQALTGNVDVQGAVTANGGLLLLEAGQGDAIINRIASLTNVSILALDLDLSGSISAGDEVQLTSLDSGTTVVLGGDGGTGTVVLRNPAGLTIDADELSRISTGKLRIDAEANDALLLDVDFTGATLGDLSVGADNSSQIIAAGSVQGLDALTLGYVDGADDRRPGLIVVPGELGQDTTTGRLGAVTLNSSQDIIIGPQAFQAFYQADDPSLASLGKLNPAAFKATRNHIFIAADDLKLYAPGDIVQLNTGSGVDGRGIVFKVAAVDEGVVNPSGDGPEKVVLFGVIIRDDGTRVTSYSAGLEPRILFPGTTDANGNVIEEPLEKSTDYRFNLCIIGDPVSCSNALLREAEPTAGVAGSDPNPYVAGPDLSFDDDDDDLDGEGDLGGVAATGNESLWGAGVR